MWVYVPHIYMNAPEARRGCPELSRVKYYWEFIGIRPGLGIWEVKSWVGEMAQQVRALKFKPGSLRSGPHGGRAELTRDTYGPHSIQ